MNYGVKIIPEASLQRVVGVEDQRVPLGTMARDEDGNIYRFARFTSNVNPGDLVFEKVVEYQLKSLRVPQDPNIRDDNGTLEAVLNVPASQDPYIDAGAIRRLIDAGASSELEGIRFKVISNEKVVNTKTSADDVTFRLAINGLRERDVKHELSETIPASYNQDTNNAVSFWLEPYLNCEVSAINGTAGTNASWVARGIAVMKVTASATTPQFGWLLVSGEGIVKTSGAVSTGALLFANDGASNGGQVQSINLSTTNPSSKEYPVGYAMAAVTAAGIVPARVQIG